MHRSGLLCRAACRSAGHRCRRPRSARLLPTPRAGHSIARPPPLDDWPLSRLAVRSMPARHQPSRSPTQTVPPLAPHGSTAQLTSWALLRSQQTGVAGSRSLASGGHARRKPGRRAPDLQFHAADRRGRSHELRRRPARRRGRRRGPRAAARQHSRCGSPPNGASARPLRRRAQRFRSVRRRRRLPAADAMAASASMPISRAAWSAFSSRDLFVDGGCAVTRPVYRQFSGRLRRVGRRPARPLPGRCRAAPDACGSAATSRVHLDWRQRLAGNAPARLRAGADARRQISNAARPWPRAAVCG